MCVYRLFPRIRPVRQTSGRACGGHRSAPPLHPLAKRSICAERCWFNEARELRWIANTDSTAPEGSQRGSDV